jgi:four helix bundle protein
MSKIKTYRDLIVWQKSMSLVTEIYKVLKVFPKDEIYGLTGQIRRSAISIPSNIAEGFGRASTNDYIRFLKVATGSLYELQTQVDIASNLGYLQKHTYNEIYELSREVERMLSSLIRRLNE